MTAPTSPEAIDALAAAIADRLSVTPPALVDAKAAAAALGVPATWVLAEARADRIPHVRLGRYVRFDIAELRGWAADQHRGPRTRGSDR